MPVAATAALIAGASMAAAGTAAAIRAQRMKAQPRSTAYGGSADALNAYREQYASGMDQGALLRNAGIQDLTGVAEQAGGMSAYGQQTAQDALFRGQNPGWSMYGQQAQNFADANQAAINMAYDAQADKAMRQNSAIAASGGPLAQRQAMAANAEVGMQMQRQRDQQLADAAIANATAAQNAVQSDRQFAIQQAQIGQDMAATGQATQLAAYRPVVDAGLGLESQYLGAQQNVEQAQSALDLDYERRRQAEQQRKAQNLWGLGQSLIGGGAKAMQSGFGGGGGYGGGG